MPKGGYRPGAGRPKGSRNAGRAGTDVASVATLARTQGLSPLAYMLDVINDESASVERRDRMAIAAAAYVHLKPTPGHLEREEAPNPAQETWDELLGDVGRVRN